MNVAVVLVILVEFIHRNRRYSTDETNRTELNLRVKNSLHSLRERLWLEI